MAACEKWHYHGVGILQADVGLKVLAGDRGLERDGLRYEDALVFGRSSMRWPMVHIMIQCSVDVGMGDIWRTSMGRQTRGVEDGK